MASSSSVLLTTTENENIKSTPISTTVNETNEPQKEDLVGSDNQTGMARGGTGLVIVALSVRNGQSNEKYLAHCTSVGSLSCSPGCCKSSRAP